MVRLQRHTRTVLVAALCCGVAAGCTGFIHGQTGKTMSSYTRQHMVPHLLGSADVDAVCRTSAALGNFLASFERVSDRPDLPVMVSEIAAGMCAEEPAREAELDYDRAVRAARSSDARDAQIRLERGHALAAERYGRAWGRFEFAFGAVGELCPKLEDDDSVFFLLGLSSGLLASMHDRAAGGVVGISTGIPAAVARAADCLDAKAWWGVPWALQVAVWAVLPTGAPADIDATQRMADAVALGDAAGVRLSRAFEVQTLASQGDAERLRAAITAHAQAVAVMAADPRWRLLDAYGALLTRHESDRIWTREEGHRTPTRGFGQFPQKAPAAADDMLDDMNLESDEGGEG